MRPMAAAAVGALIAGLGMYAVGARPNQDPFARMPAYVQTVDGRYIEVPNAKAVGYAPMGFAPALQPAAQPMVLGQAPAPRTVYPTAAAQPVQERVVVQERRAGRRQQICGERRSRDELERGRSPDHGFLSNCRGQASALATLAAEAQYPLVQIEHTCN